MITNEIRDDLILASRNRVIVELMLQVREAAIEAFRGEA